MAQHKQPRKKQKEDMSINDLAKIVAKGFESVDKRMDGFENSMTDMEARLSQKIDGINNRIDDLALNRATREEVYLKT